MPTSEHAIFFSILDAKFCVAKLGPNSRVPELASTGEFLSITYTQDEVSIICQEGVNVPEAQIERGWRCLKVSGPLEFALKGVLASLLTPLAEASIGVLAISTYETDYVLVKQHQLTAAIHALESAGHRLSAT